VRMTLNAIPFRGSGTNTAAVAVVLRVEPGVSAAPGGPSTLPHSPAAESERPRGETVNVVVAALDPVSGRLIGTLTQKAELPWPPGASRSAAYELLSRMNLAPGRYEIRAALESSTGARAGVYGYVEVPRFDNARLSLSGATLHILPAQSAEPKKILADLLPVTPTARREMRAADQVTAFVRAYQPQGMSRDISVVARVLDAEGVARFEDHRIIEADYLVSLPVDQFPPGDYLLEITATSGGDIATRGVRFSMQR
jgi:hypothetical protein